MVAAILSVTWLRWMDPVIDFGRELYIPWRILAGEHPVHDFVHLYGPFSVYTNAGLFALFGPAVRTLVVANLLIFAVTFSCLFVVTRRAFGFLPAVLAVAVAIPVYGFPHYGSVNNYTYAAPYSHETTHGMALLLLTLVWLGRPGGGALRPAGGLVAGLLFGLSCLTKTEFILVAALLWTTCVLRLALDPAVRIHAGRWIAASMGGVAMVFAAATLALWSVLPAAAALRSAGNALLAPFAYRALAQSPLGLKLLGADQAGANALMLVVTGVVTWAVLATVAFAVRRPGAGHKTGSAALLIGLLGAAAAGIAWIPWLGCARAFPGVLAGGMVWLLVRHFRTRTPATRLTPRLWCQGIFFVAGAGMLARMALEPRINHYGFFQALLAGTWVAGFLLGEWPRLLAPARRLQLGLVAAVTVLLVGGATTLWSMSLTHYRNKSTVIGNGGDRLLGFRSDVNDLPALWESVRAHLAATTRPDSTLLVVPEGLSLNYATRRRHPLRILDVLPATMALNGREVLPDLMAAPPDTIVLVSRDMTEFGYRAYGEDARSGRALVEWITRHYRAEAKAGDFPFEPGKLGLWVMRRNPP